MSEEPSGRADTYEQMMRLADLFDSAGDDVRARATLGDEVLADPAVADSAALAPTTWGPAEEDIRAATTGRHGLLTRSLELDADALVLRATVLTYQWIDQLQAAAYRTLGSIAGRAIGYLAPQVALGGAIVSVGLIDPDALERDDVTAYLSELAESDPELLDQVAGGGGLLDGLAMRSLLTTGLLAGDGGAAAARGGLRALGTEAFPTGLGPALRDVAGARVSADPDSGPGPLDPTPPRLVEHPRGLGDLLTGLAAVPRSVAVQKVGPGRYIAYLPGPGGGTTTRLRLVSGDHTSYDRQVVRAIEAAVAGDREPPRVLLVGVGPGGVTAAQIAAENPSSSFVVDQVVTAGAPSAQAPRLPAGTHMLALEDRSDPVALLGSLVNAFSEERMTVVFEAGPVDGTSAYVLGARAADRAPHPELRAELTRLRDLGYLAD